jgi:predicted RNA polymerase sigma factor
MSLHQLGKTNEARQAYDEAVRLDETYMPSPLEHRELTALRTEARLLLHSPPR